jgi:hypothetical protein
MKKSQGKSRGFRKYISALRNVMKEELDSFASVPEEIEQNQNLLWDIKEMLQNALVGAYLAPPPKELMLAVFHERFRLDDEKRRALDALNVAWDHAQDLRTLLRNVPPIIREWFIASIREEIANQSSAGKSTTQEKTEDS